MDPLLVSFVSSSKPQEHYPHQGPEEPAAVAVLWATAAETPTTALAGFPVNQTHHPSYPSSRSRRSGDGAPWAVAGAAAQADTVRYSGSGVSGGKGGRGDAKGSRSGAGGLLPGSSVLRHRVRKSRVHGGGGRGWEWLASLFAWGGRGDGGDAR